MSKTTQKNRLLSITTPLGEDFLLINRLTATEEISSLFSYEVELLHAEEQPGFEPTAVDAKAILGKAVSIEIDQRVHRTKRTLAGIVNHFSQGHRDTRFSYYHATIVPHIWLLTQVNQSRIFQHKNVPDILREVFKGFEVSYELQQGDFKARNYCVQYRETDFDFASRLMEEEGIYYFFEHSDGKHKMILGNTPQSHPDCPSKSDIPFALKVNDEEDYITSIKKWQNDHRLQSGKVSFRDYHFQISANKLEAAQPSLFQIADNDKMELYDFPAGYARKYDDVDRGGGERSDVQNVFEDKQKKAEIAMQSLDSQYRVITGTSDCSSLTAGHRFNFFDHPSAEQNGQYVVTAVTHEAEQNPTYVTDDDIEQPYGNSFSCIAYGKGSPPFRPVRKTQKPIVQGSQTAMVVGPAGEEIFTDKYGRVKVQFHWDRGNTYNPDSSCWVRVAHDIAGKKWGEMHIPRIGQEVIVDFMEGDPDQPIITGSVYNNLSMPHYDLPKYKTLTYLKTRTTPDDGKGFNELRFEDKQGKEQVFIHSQKRMDVRVRQSLYETCGGNRQEVIGMRSDNQPGGNLAISVGGNFDLYVKGNQYIDIKGKLNETIGGDLVEKNEGKLATVVTNTAELNARQITLEALTQMTFKVGASFITLDLTGITIQGPIVKINSGGAATGTSPVDIEHALYAESADTGEPGYLDRPRTGGGWGGRRRETLNGQHGPEATRDENGVYHVGNIAINPGNRNPNFQRDTLNDIAIIGTTERGRQTLDSIQNNPNGNQVTIVERNNPSDPTNGGAIGVNGANAGNGTGTNTTIDYDPTVYPVANSTDPRSQHNSPSDAILHHELVHASHFTNGTRDGTPRTDCFTDNEEFNTIGNPGSNGPDNTYRRERGIQERNNHKDY